MYNDGMYIRMLDYPLTQRNSFFLFGPRGTGKTVWVKTRLKESLYLDLLDAEIYTDLLARPQRLADFIPAEHNDWIVIDEVQRIPELLDEVHRLIVMRRYRFVLTGSSSRSLKRKGVNLLAGRARRYMMYPLIKQELEEDFNLGRSVLYGLLPMAVTETDPRAYLNAYVQTYLREEVLQEGLTRNLAAFSRFLESASLSQGNVLNISDVAREAGVDRQRVSGYFTILEDLLLAWRLAPFTKRAKRRMQHHPKFYFFDAGVYRALRPMGPLDSPEEAQGAALETLFLQSLKAVNDYLQLGYEIYYWRTSSGIEVDFVAYGERGICAFEIKRTRSLSGKSFRGLRSFLRDYPQSRCYLVYGGNRREYHDDVYALPFETALAELPDVLA